MTVTLPMGKEQLASMKDRDSTAVVCQGSFAYRQLLLNQVLVVNVEYHSEWTRT
jgi:hypothetical protein